MNTTSIWDSTYWRDFFWTFLGIDTLGDPISVLAAFLLAAGLALWFWSRRLIRTVDGVNEIQQGSTRGQLRAHFVRDISISLIIASLLSFLLERATSAYAKNLLTSSLDLLVGSSVIGKELRIQIEDAHLEFEDFTQTVTLADTAANDLSTPITVQVDTVYTLSAKCITSQTLQKTIVGVVPEQPVALKSYSVIVEDGRVIFDAKTLPDIDKDFDKDEYDNNQIAAKVVTRKPLSILVSDKINKSSIRLQRDAFEWHVTGPEVEMAAKERVRVKMLEEVKLLTRDSWYRRMRYPTKGRLTLNIEYNVDQYFVNSGMMYDIPYWHKYQEDKRDAAAGLAGRNVRKTLVIEKRGILPQQGAYFEWMPLSVYEKLSAPKDK